MTRRVRVRKPNATSTMSRSELSPVFYGPYSIE